MKKYLLLIAAVITVGLASCDPDDHTDQTNNQDIFIYNSLAFIDGTCEKEMTVGDKLSLPYKKGDKVCSWKSEDATVAKVVVDELDITADPKLEAVAAGNTVIKDVNSNLKLYVTVKKSNAGIGINIFTYNSFCFYDGICEHEMSIGDKLLLPTDKDGKNCSWKSGNTSVATVTVDTSSGKQYLNAVGAGKATVSDDNTNLKINLTVK